MNSELNPNISRRLLPPSFWAVFACLCPQQVLTASLLLSDSFYQWVTCFWRWWRPGLHRHLFYLYGSIHNQNCYLSKQFKIYVKLNMLPFASVPFLFRFVWWEAVWLWLAGPWVGQVSLPYCRSRVWPFRLLPKTVVTKGPTKEPPTF